MPSDFQNGIPDTLASLKSYSRTVLKRKAITYFGQSHTVYWIMPQALHMFTCCVAQKFFEGGMVRQPKQLLYLRGKTRVVLTLVIKASYEMHGFAHCNPTTSRKKIHIWVPV